MIFDEGVGGGRILSETMGARLGDTLRCWLGLGKMNKGWLSEQELDTEAKHGNCMNCVGSRG